MAITDIVVLNQALIREVINGYAMILCLALTMMVGVFMWDSVVDWYERAAAGRNPLAKTGATWAEVPGIQTACALWWIFLAETYRTGAVWMLYQIGKNANDNGPFFSSGAYWSSYGYLLAGVVLNLGLLRAIYIFTPPEWKDRVWIYATVAAGLFCAAPSVLKTALRIYIDGL